MDDFNCFFFFFLLLPHRHLDIQYYESEATKRDMDILIWDVCMLDMPFSADLLGNPSGILNSRT